MQRVMDREMSGPAQVKALASQLANSLVVRSPSAAKTERSGSHPAFFGGSEGEASANSTKFGVDDVGHQPASTSAPQTPSRTAQQTPSALSKEILLQHRIAKQDPTSKSKTSELQLKHQMMRRKSAERLKPQSEFDVRLKERASALEKAEQTPVKEETEFSKAFERHTIKRAAQS
eukprot:m.189564 g.189564  ORF g.189564 m.189564 type:complete len:175 (+) comp14796_c0_seq1:443-967(+)